MGQTTGIEWCDSTLNLEIGCDGCELWNPKVGEKTCYAGQIVERYGGHSKGYPESFDKPALFPKRLDEAERWKDLTGTERPDKPWLNGMPRTIFLDDMGDTFTESLPLYWLAEHLPRLAAMPAIIILLTKRANRMLEFSKTHPFPKNFWLLVSVTSAANYNRIEQLMQVDGGSVKGISYEPAWGPIDIEKWLCDGHPSQADIELSNPRCFHNIRHGIPRLQWIISGGSSGTTAKPAHPKWFRDIRDVCVENGVAYFHKQNGEFSDVGSVRAPEQTVCAIDGWSGDFTKESLDEHVRKAHGGEISCPPFQLMHRVGKKAAGAMLDGREWHQMPEVLHA